MQEEKILTKFLKYHLKIDLIFSIDDLKKSKLLQNQSSNRSIQLHRSEKELDFRMRSSKLYAVTV